MAKKSTSKPSRRGVKRTRRPPRPMAAKPARPKLAGVNLGDISKMAKVLTPEQAFELYRANARMALDVIDAAIESTAKLRKLQFEGEEEARSMQKKAVRHAAEANDPQSLVAAGQAVTQEAVEKALHYWTQMFDMIVEIQKRLFTLIEQQMGDVPGAREARAAMAMMPDLRQAQGLVRAMQGMMSSGGSAFESMQRVMGDFTRLAQQTVPGLRR
ncbi:MAG TPA: TIGR01841 family phasin [Casimicrobiaceae bacterium]|nr:TIGR01841 family phasin [Casimicrobiaceae bacterium]